LLWLLFLTVKIRFSVFCFLFLGPVVPLPPPVEGGCVEIVASGLLIGTRIPEMGPLEP
jgi:hypothetical protein